jgi:hypothetical protein
MNCQINSTQVGINMQSMLAQLLTMVSRDELIKWNNMTPTYIDNYARYQDAFTKVSSVVTGTVGADPIVGGVGSAYVPNVNNPLACYGSGVDPCYVPRGSWYFDSVVNPIGTGAIIPAGGASVTVTVREPLLLSPLLFALEGVGLQGVNQFNFQINIDSTGRRVWRRCPTNADGTGNRMAGFAISSIDFGQSSSKMYVNFLTPSPYQLAKFSPRNVCDYYQLDRYVTDVTTTPAAGSTLAVGASGDVTTTSVQLATIPDKLILCIRENPTQIDNSVPDRFLTIENVSLNFNAKQNILAQASQQLLFRYSVEAGSQQTWLEFSGKAAVGGSAGGQTVVGTSGSVLCLDLGRHIDIPEMYLAAGSAGQFNLQVKITYRNNTGAILTSPQVVMIVMTSGVFSTEKGQSQVFTSLLNKDGVMAVLDEKPVSSASLKRLVGGSWLSSLMKVGKSVLPALAPVAKDMLRSTGNKYASAGADVIGALGFGRSAGGVSGGGVSGGGRSAGALKKHYM